MDQPSAVIFDVEGTLVDCVSLTLESWRQTLLSAGYSFTLRDLQPYSGMDGEWMLERLVPEATQELRRDLLKQQGEHYRSDFIARAEPFAAVRDLFQQLKGRDIAVGIATTCKRDELAIYDERMKVVGLADAICCGETVKHGKPDPALLKCCLDSLEIADPGTAFAIGDTPFDALAGKALGLHCVGLLTGGFSADSLREAGHEHIFEEIREVASLWWRDEPRAGSDFDHAPA